MAAWIMLLMNGACRAFICGSLGNRSQYRSLLTWDQLFRRIWLRVSRFPTSGVNLPKMRLLGLLAMYASAVISWGDGVVALDFRYT